ncbi:MULTISPECIES: ATP-binding protein [unclassified Streptomyces]|uniref:ATP-binding protein n=1 Tax=unclassified Streptomyces TaxID=2593676 RepID=UPI000B25D0F3|nr:MULTISPECIES: ATP-binding protein [unclassified Streptomyces]
MPVVPAQEAVTVRVFAQRFSSTRRGAHLARLLAAHQLHLWGVPYDSPHSDAVLLVVAELAANAALHGCVPGRNFELRLLRDEAAGRVRVEVSDTHAGRPVLAAVPVDGEHGRGLLLVDSVASRWGVSLRQGPGKTVWVEIACP